MAPDLPRGGWWQRLRRAVAGLTSRMVAPADAVAALPNDDPVGGVCWIEPGNLTERLESRSAPVILDVRGADEFAGKFGHIADALNVALPQLLGRVDEFARYRDRDLVLVCHTQIRSAQAAHLLNQAGFSRVSVLRGGMVEWRRQGLPVEGAGSAAGA